MKRIRRVELSDNLIKLFQNKNYEKYVLEIMNNSTKVFPGEYKYVDEQSNGECDYIDVNTGAKYDAKVPFHEKQIRMLVNGEKYKPQIGEWINIMRNEEYEFYEVMKNDPENLDVNQLKLYKLMKEQILKDKEDENIVFFIPYPIITSVGGSIFLQFAANYLNSIYDQLEKEIDFTNRSVFVIYPSSQKNEFAIKDLKHYNTEYIQYDKMSKYFSYETNFSIT